MMQRYFVIERRFVYINNACALQFEFVVSQSRSFVCIAGANPLQRGAVDSQRRDRPQARSKYHSKAGGKGVVQSGGEQQD